MLEGVTHCPGGIRLLIWTRGHPGCCGADRRGCQYLCWKTIIHGV